MSSITIPIVLLVLFLVTFFACGYGFGNWVEAATLKRHGEEIDALSTTIEELYTGLQMVYKAYTGDLVTEEEARQAALRAEWLLDTVEPPIEVEAAE